jgi:hypothetical protein
MTRRGGGGGSTNPQSSSRRLRRRSATFSRRTSRTFASSMRLIAARRRAAMTRARASPLASRRAAASRASNRHRIQQSATHASCSTGRPRWKTRQCFHATTTHSWSTRPPATRGARRLSATWYLQCFQHGATSARRGENPPPSSAETARRVSSIARDTRLESTSAHQCRHRDPSASRASAPLGRGPAYRGVGGYRLMGPGARGRGADDSGMQRRVPTRVIICGSLRDAPGSGGNNRWARRAPVIRSQPGSISRLDWMTG